MTLTAAEVRSTTFPATSLLRRGYDAGEVDTLLERIAVRLETGDGLNSNDVYHAVLGRSRRGGRGYPEVEVDAFLDRVHAQLSRLEESWTHARATTDPAQPDPDADADAEDTAGSADPAPSPDTDDPADRPDR